MSRFERQLRIWGDRGQTRIESCQIVVKEFPPTQVVGKLLVSLGLAGLSRIYALVRRRCPERQAALFCPPVADISELLAEKHAADAPIIYILDQSEPFVEVLRKEDEEQEEAAELAAPSPVEEQDTDLPASLRPHVHLTVTIRTALPVFTATFQLNKAFPRLVLRPDQKRIPPFSLFEVADRFADLEERWLEPPYKTKKLPWLLVLTKCARELRFEPAGSLEARLREMLRALPLDAACLKSARLHMAWILYAPSCRALINDCLDKRLAVTDEEILSALKDLGRFPVAGPVPTDEQCDPEPWDEFAARLHQIRDEDFRRLAHLDPILLKTGLGSLHLVLAAEDAEEADCELNKLIQENQDIDTLLQPQPLSIPHLAQVLCDKPAVQLNGIVLRALQLILSQPAAEVVRRFPALEHAASRPEEAKPPMPFVLAFTNLVGASLSTEILKIIVQQFTLKFGAVCFDIRSTNSIHLPLIKRR